MDTSSFAELEAGWQGHLRWLHDDYFYRRHEQLWSEQALESLPALMKATDMLVCGEDLGMVPDCVHPVLRRLGLLGKLPLSAHATCMHKLHFSCQVLRLPLLARILLAFWYHHSQPESPMRCQWFTHAFLIQAVGTIIGKTSLP